MQPPLGSMELIFDPSTPQSRDNATSDDYDLQIRAFISVDPRNAADFQCPLPQTTSVGGLDFLFFALKAWSGF
jgi:hypothetical protein